MHSNEFVNALTIDFEDWYQGLEIPMAAWRQYEDRVTVSGRRLLQIFAEADVKATFFVLGDIAERYPAIIKDIVAAGHEIGTHGYSHTLVYKQSRNEFRAELYRAIGILEDLTGNKIYGHRAPFFSITKKSLWALEVLAERGLEYDASIFPVINYRYGIPNAPRWPYRVK